MKEYLITLLSVSAVLSIALSVSHTALRGSVRAALGLMLLLTLAGPLISAFSKLTSPQLPDAPAIDTDGGFEEITSEAFSEGIALSLVDRWGEGLRGCSVICRGFSVSDMLADSISVSLPQSAAMIDYREVRQFVKDNFTRDGYCEVYYG